MSKPTATWKAAERKIAEMIGGRRRGPDYRGENAGKTDIVLKGWAVEVKHLATPIWSRIVAAVKQASRDRGHPDDIPVAIIHKAGTPYSECLVVMDINTFVEHFVNLGGPDIDYVRNQIEK